MKDMKPIVDLMDKSQRELQSIHFSHSLSDDQKRLIAIAIGHHFWNCEDDEAAEDMASDCMRDIEKATS